jgi:hypothetical protein
VESDKPRAEQSANIGPLAGRHVIFKNNQCAIRQSRLVFQLATTTSRGFIGIGGIAEPRPPWSGDADALQEALRGSGAVRLSLGFEY